MSEPVSSPPPAQSDASPLADRATSGEQVVNYSVHRRGRRRSNRRGGMQKERARKRMHLVIQITVVVIVSVLTIYLVAHLMFGASDPPAST